MDFRPRVRGWRARGPPLFLLLDRWTNRELTNPNGTAFFLWKIKIVAVNRSGMSFNPEIPWRDVPKWILRFAFREFQDNTREAQNSFCPRVVCALFFHLLTWLYSAILRCFLYTTFYDNLLLSTVSSSLNTCIFRIDSNLIGMFPTPYEYYEKRSKLDRFTSTFLRLTER